MADLDLNARLKGFQEGLDYYENLRKEAEDKGDKAGAKKYEDAIRGCLKGIERYVDAYLR